MSAIDYAPAKQWAAVVHAIFIIESHENPLAVGDGGQALGLGQMHPTFFAEYYGSSPEFQADLHDTWSEAQIKAAAAFFERHLLPLDLAVQAYNQGVDAVTRKGVRAPDYLARFGAAYALVRATTVSK